LKFNDAVIGAILLALSLLVLFHVSSFPNISGQNIGPAAFPRLIAVLLAGCSTLLILRGWRERGVASWVVWRSWLRSPLHLLRFGLAVVVLLAYARWSERLGFIPSGVLLLLVMFSSLQVRLTTALAVALGLTLLMHGIFYSLLRVPLPWGVLERWAW
jgi:putative tricarboxylic transport membrane protein